MQILCFIIVLCVFASSAIGAYPESTVGYEQPVYNLTANQPKDGSYEVRRYATSKWARTNVTAWSWEEASATGFKRLFAYISGDNNRQIKMDMTVPVVVGFYANPCVFCQDHFTVWFYIPEIYQASPPIPTDPSISIILMESWVEYFRIFSGFAVGDRPYKETNHLSKDMKKNGMAADIDESTMYLGSYDPPFKMFHRHNEVSMIKAKK
uniref:Uncharacterized protein n=1 Tax=Ciona savignyi TaxID=51511 RepID=H2ZMX7_CIOSA